MADAGKIVITPKGKYNSTTTYEWLDEVTYDGKAYIALKTVTGVTPSDDGVNWRLFLEPNDIVAGNLVPTFTEASTRTNIISGENLSTILGKVKKYFTDLKGHAFNDTVNNLTTSTTGSALDASQGKVLQGEVDEINSNLNVVFKTREIDAPRCVLTDNKNTITSDYGYTYSDISTMLTNGDYKKYIKNGDYIRLTTLNDETFNMIFNINTYKDYGDTSVGSHIDLISEHLIPSSHGWQMRTENTNNGTADITNPFLASTNMIDKLSTYFTNNIPDGLKSHIVTKRLLVPTRYSAEGTLTDDNNYEWEDLGKMWLPFEQEVTGRQVCGSREYQGGLRWYPCFQDGTQLNKRLGDNGVRLFWWTASARSGYSTNFVRVGEDGAIYYTDASGTWLAVPLCMRFK